MSPTGSPSRVTTPPSPKPSLSPLRNGETRSPTLSPTTGPTGGPVLFPTRSPSLDCPLTTDPPTNGPQLEIVASGPFAECQGSCSDDSDCQSGLGLTCYKTYLNGPYTVPGCSG